MPTATILAGAHLVVTVAGLATGVASGLGPIDVVFAFGKAFTESRYVAIVWLVLPSSDCSSARDSRNAPSAGPRCFRRCSPLGALLAVAGVGKVVAGLAERWIPLDSPFIAVVTYTVGMAVFTMIMDNAFAAFPMMTAGIGLPLIITRFGGRSFRRRCCCSRSIH